MTVHLKIILNAAAFFALNYASFAADKVQTVDGTEVRVFSAVPKPGMHPRIFISPEDLTGLRQAVASSPAKSGHYANLKKMVAETLDNPSKPEGKVLAAVAGGTVPTDAHFASATGLSQQLALAGLDALITENKERGALLARTLSLYGDYQLRTWVRQPDPVGLHNSFDSQFCLAYDFIAPWMDEAQRKPARQFIARMIDGINLFTHDWPSHMRMWNWAGLHVYQGWGSLAIEGEEGWNPHLWNQARRIIRDFFSYNVHPSGALTEDITYFSFAMRGAGPAVIAMARRDDLDVLGKGSNLRQLRNHLINQLHPWGEGFMSHQDGGGDGFYAMWPMLKYLYPTDPALDFAYRNRVGPDYMKGVGGNDGDIRPWATVLFGTEFFPEPVPPATQKLPLTYFCPTRSYLVTRSAWDKDAVKLDFEAKTDYPTVGHNHADANNFTLAALGREWATELGYHAASGHLHNNVVIDGRSQSPWPMPGGRWIDLIDRPEATIGVADASHAYNWRWTNSGWGVKNDPPPDYVKWELETLPEVRAFVKEQADSGKGRQSIFEHHGPVLRGEWNPVEKAFRTAALVRGKCPYLFIVDDIRKDDAIRLYEWAMFMPEDVEVIRTGPRWIVLGAKEIPADPKIKEAKPRPDKRRLLVQIVDVNLASDKDGMAIALENTPITNEPYENSKPRNRLVIPARSSDPRYKVLLYPHYEGDPLPDVIWNGEHNAVQLVFPDQTDRWSFADAQDGRTAMNLDRDGRRVAAVQAAPAAPRIISSPRMFTSRLRVELALPGQGQEIRYTLDGSEPGPKSTHYAGPFWISKNCRLKAATFARGWEFGKSNRSPITEASFTRADFRQPVEPADTEPGLRAVVYSGFWNKLPDFSEEKPLFTSSVPGFSLPSATPPKGFGVEFSGFIRVPADGVYVFSLRNDDASKLWIGDQLVVDNDGAHIVGTRTGEVALRAGLHPIRVGYCDAALALGTGKGDGSWAFAVGWAPQGSAPAPIPEDVLVRASGLQSTAPAPEKIDSAGQLKTVPGLVYSAYDRSQETGQPVYFETPADRMRWRTTADLITEPDSSPGLLHVYEGFLLVPHAGEYQFQLSVSGVAELALGKSVVARVGAGEANTARSTLLPEGLVPFTLKLGKYKGPVLWRGPGMDWQSIASRDLFRRQETVKVIRQGDFLGYWSAGKIENNRLVNLSGGAAGSLALPDGTLVVDDPETGKALRLENSSIIRLQPTGILANELTVSFRLKAVKNAVLFRYGYAHFGVFANINNGDVLGGGGGVHSAYSTKGGKLKDDKWHTATFTYGGIPLRKIQVYLDGRFEGEGRSKSPCLTDNLEFLNDFTGDVAEIRLYNRILSPEEIKDLVGKTPKP
ncbi:MAG: PA14 domain-containing protein [Candidatus Methylacidiphilales bacterium]|nr:PA14 domain-containing protein [Candidatus Methylacidiphilales bacterium]